MSRQHIAVIGAGWAGIAAATSLVQAGCHVHLYEAARTAGGRARSITLKKTSATAAAVNQANELTLDNGQHILIGAYRQSLALIEQVGTALDDVLWRMPLDLRDIHGRGLRLPRLPSPLDGLFGILRAKGWSMRDKAALLWQLQQWQRARFQTTPEKTVADLCEQLPQSITQELIEPLCVAGMNTPIAAASASLFLRMLHDSLIGGKGSADLLLPRVPLGQLLAEPALQWLGQQSMQVHMGQRVHGIQYTGSSIDRAAGLSSMPWQVDGQPYHSVIVATHSAEAIRLMQGIVPAPASLHNWLACARKLQHESIATVYVQQHTTQAQSMEKLLPRPMVMLQTNQQAPAQFVFDRGQLDAQQGLLAFVISASHGEKQALETATLAQAQQLLHTLHIKPQLEIVGTVIEKRATFACTAGLIRPPAQPITLLPTLQVCGDYIQGAYPGTLEGAVISGQQAASSVLSSFTADEDLHSRRAAR